MFEDMTYENILNRALQRVSDEVDKRQGSIIYDALAPACAELAIAYIWLDEILNKSFADTASREYLIRRAAERGLEPYPATYAVLKGKFNCAVDIGTRFNLEGLNYVVTELIDDTEHTYRLRCETAGAEGNNYLGKMTPIDYVAGLTSAELTEVLVYGEDVEDTEVFRRRYFDNLNTQAFGGNVADYKQKVKALDGVGQVRVYRADEWNGGGTVKIVVTDSENGVPSTELIQTLQEDIDPVDYQGTGVGIAPIGHIVTVAGVNNETINVVTTLELAENYTADLIKPYVENAIKSYLDGLNSQWEPVFDSGRECIVIPVAVLAGQISTVPGVINIKALSVNGKVFGESYTVAKDCICVPGYVVVEEQSTN